MPSASKTQDQVIEKNAKSRKKKRKKIRFRKLAFKLTHGQLEALEKLCRQKNTTPIRFLKAMVNNQVEYYRNAPPVSYVTENQLELFDAEMLTD